MRYLGSKRRIKKYILPIILADRQPNQLYWEPFVGGANTFQDVSNPRLGSDLNPYLIALLVAVRDGWIPPTGLTEEEYKLIKANPNKYPKELVGFAGHCTFGAMWFSSFAKCHVRSESVVTQTANSLRKTALRVQGSKLICGDYTTIAEIIPNNSIIYCDPPYSDTAYGYYNSKFDSDRFWQWAAEMSKHHQVFVSEYEAPQGWQSIWQQEIPLLVNKLKTTADKTRTEKLFKLEI